MEQTLPGFENHTPDQLFFVSNGISTCATIQKSQAELLVEVCIYNLFQKSSVILIDFNLIQSDVHAPWYFRTIGSIQNNAEFAKAFNCPIDSPMNPKTKCVIW